MLRRRYRRILFFFARLWINIVFWDILLPKLGFGKISERTRTERYRKAAVRYRRLAVSMGGVLIKVGQFLSSRVDVLPSAFTAELEGLQDEVPPEKFEDLRRVAEAEFGKRLEDVFIRIETVPVAAASIGQAHLAWIVSEPDEEVGFPPQITGTINDHTRRVVVKIQRPNIEQLVSVDLAALRKVGGWLNWFSVIRKRANIPALIADFSKTLYQEMDYLQEAANAEEFAGNFASEPRVIVPAVIRSFTTRRVITLEDVTAMKISDYDAIVAADVSRAEVATLLFQTYLKQIFIDQFFHADPHPGNLFVVPGSENGSQGRVWQLAYIDFGMMGHITPAQRSGLRDMAIAITTQDAARAVRAYEELGFLLPGADTRLIERAGTDVFNLFWGKSTAELRQITIQQVLDFTRQYRDLLYSLPFQLPTDLILLGRALAILSGMCAGLDPNFNVWLSIMPYAQELIAEQRKGGFEQLQHELGNLERSLARLPGRLSNLLVQMETGELSTRNPQLNERINRLEKSTRRTSYSVIFAAFLITGVLLTINNFAIYGGLSLGLAVLFLLAYFFTRY